MRATIREAIDFYAIQIYRSKMEQFLFVQNCFRPYVISAFQFLKYYISILDIYIISKTEPWQIILYLKRAWISGIIIFKFKIVLSVC